MPDIPTEAVEASALHIAEWLDDHGVSDAHREAARDAPAAALPHLPQRVSPSVEDVARAIGRWVPLGTMTEAFHERMCRAAAGRVLALLSSQPTVEQVRREALAGFAAVVTLIHSLDDALRGYEDPGDIDIEQARGAIADIAQVLDGLELRARAAEAGEDRG